MMKTQEKYTDRELVDRILNQETALFELVIRRNNASLYRIGMMYRFSHEDTQDLMQDAYIEAFKHLHQFENRSSLCTWISKIMLNLCYRKTQTWSAKNVERMTESTPVSDSETNETSDIVMNKELNSVIEKSLLNIPEKYRIAFALREINGLSVLETANILEVSEGNVKVRVNRAKTYLRNEIEKFYNKEEIFEFNLIYCDAMVDRVMKKISMMIKQTPEK